MISSTKSGAPGAATARRGLRVGLESKVTQTLTLYLAKDSSLFLALSATFNNEGSACRKL
jgi:hypothetical protein